VDVRDIGRQLRVAAVLEGSVRAAGDRIRITAQLIGAADGYHLWSETYDRPSNEILATQASIAQAIAANLTPRLASHETIPSIKRHTASPAAYDLVLKARYLDPIAGSAEQRIGSYRQALEHDPNYADAYIGLADEWLRQAVQGSALPREVMPKASDATAKALRLDDTLPAAHYESAMIRWTYDWDWAGADQEFRKTLQLNPSSAPARVEYARYLALMGRREEALRQLEHLRALDPLSAASRGVEAAVFYLTGDYDRTIEHARAVLAGQPDLWLLKFWMGRAYDSKGQLPEAIATLEQWRSIPGTLQGSGFGILGCLYARVGRRAEALQLVEAQIARSKRSHVSPSSVALVYIGLGDSNRAIEWLEKAYEERDHTLVALKIDPAYLPMRSDPRFIALLRRIRLE